MASQTVGSVPADGVVDPRRLAAIRASGMTERVVFAGLDRLVELASDAAEAPIALVTVVESDRQWFASMTGLSEPWSSARQSPLTHSFCQHVVNTREPLVVTDAREHPLLRENPGIDAFGIIAYAGYPLTLPTGHVLGTLCVADTSPRPWTERELRWVEQLAAVATAEVCSHLAEREATRQERFLDALLESLDVGVAACDTNGTVVLTNDTLRRSSGVANHRWTGGEWNERVRLTHPDGRLFTVEERPLTRALRGERVRDVQLVLRAPDGTSPLLAANAQPIYDQEGRLLGAVGAFHDLSDRQRAARLAEELARAKDEYIALVSHEFRTPLTSISAYAELLESSAAAWPEADRELLDVIVRNTSRLRRLVEDVVDLAALDAGTAIHFEPIAYSALVRDCLTSAGPAADAQGVTLHPSIAEGLVVAGDPQRLGQVIDNLVNNAIKYSPSGGPVTVTVALDGADTVLTISDTGIGISPEDRDHIFDRFHRSTRARKCQIPGTGLGLALSRTIIERHGGTLTLGPATTIGTTFVLRLPLAGDDLPADTPPP